MTFEKIGFDITGLTNLTMPNVTISSANDIITSAPTIANELTGHWLGFVIMLTVSFYLYWTFADKTRDANFLYDDVRAMSLSTGIALNLGAMMLNLGMITNIKHVGFFLVLFAFAEILILWVERKNDS